MTTDTTTQSALDSGRKESGAARRKLALFCILIVSIPLGMLVLSLFLVASPVFQKYCDNHWISSERNLFFASDRPCDILIYGDSTAMAGLDPRVISQRTHKSACNISSPMNAAFSLVGMMPLERYLQRNPHPQYLLFQFNAHSIHKYPEEHFAPGAASIDGYIPLLRYGYINVAIPSMLSHPDTFLGIMHYVYISGVQNLHMRVIGKHFLHVDEAAGSYTVMPLPALTSCVDLHEIPLVDKDIQSIQGVRKQFSPYAQKILFNAAPISPCNPAHQQWQAALAGATDNSLQLYPNNLFVDEAHLTRAGSIRLSEETADQILALENQKSPSAPAVHP